MSDVPQDAWFYTREGERLGPVTLAELRIKAQEASLNPRLDMVWTAGMAEWQAAGEIEGLFERRSTAATPESPVPAADPYAPPQHEAMAAGLGRDGEWPGARRRSFLIATILFPFVWNFGFALGSVFLASQLGPEIMVYVGMGAMILPVLVAIYFGLMRLVNLGMSRWWYLANFVPLLNLWVGYRCFACPSGYAYHKKLDGVGVALAIFYWLLLALGLLALVVLVALWFGAIDSPALQEQLRDLLRAVREQSTPR